MKRRAFAAVAPAFLGFPNALRAQGLPPDTIDMSRYTVGNLPSDFVTA
jgi:hypothetical protein